MRTVALSTFIGRPIESLTLAERWLLVGHWVALQIYTPELLPLRLIEAIGLSVSECLDQLQQRELNPAQYLIEPLYPPY